MTRPAWFAFLVISAGLTALVSAGQYNKKISIGDSVPSFSSLPAVGNKTVSLTDFADKDVLVVVVTCNHCPVATAYEDRLINFAKKYSAKPDSKVALVAVNVNNIDPDKLPKMEERKIKRLQLPVRVRRKSGLGPLAGRHRNSRILRLQQRSQTRLHRRHGR